MDSRSAQQNLEAWEDAKKDIDAISEHPNKLPPPPAGANNTGPYDVAPGASSSGTNRRDSVATINGR
jgi:sorting nexin-4